MTTYDEKKKQFDDMMTLYGRKPVQEILSDPSIDVFRLHLAETNRKGGIVDEILALATQRNIEVRRHNSQALSRISKNARQDQGVAIDIRPPHYRALDDVPDTAKRLIALDGITNPQNLGMIIRTIAASPVDGLVLPKKGCAKIDPLVFKASAGNLFKAHIFHCATLATGLKSLKSRGFTIAGLDGAGQTSLYDEQPEKTVYVLGNETTGMTRETIALCDTTMSIPLANDVESLNVASATTLVAFRDFNR